MFAISREFTFARLRLEIDSTSEPFLVNDGVSARSVLPMGMRVDLCSLFTINFQGSADELITVGFGVEPVPPWSASPNTGQYLDAFSLEHPDGHVAAIGMRDCDWFVETHDLVLVEAFSEGDRPHHFGATYRVRKSIDFEVHLAAAFTSSPANDSEECSPWFAVDLTL